MFRAGHSLWRILATSALLVTLIAAYSLARLPDVPLYLRLLCGGSGVLAAVSARKALRSPPITSYGSAGFLSHEEGKELTFGSLADLPEGAIFLGERDRTFLALPPPYPMQHGLIIGGSGTGKSFSFFLPNLRFARGVSVVATDPKSELWNYTSGYRRSVRYAPTDPQASAGFNWIPLCQDARMATLCARAVVEAGETERQEAPWPDLETAFLAALFSHTSRLSVPTPLCAYELLTRNPPEVLMAQFLSSPSPVAREQAIIFQQTHERMRGSITPVLAAKLQFMRDPRVARFTSSVTTAPDFGRLRLRPETLYWCVREQDMALLRPLSSLFFTLLLEQIAAESVSDSSATRVYLFLDEFANLGVIPNYDTTISLARGRGVSLWHGIQSLSQLEARYGRANAQTILTNCAAKIALSGLDVETATYFSKALGESTVQTVRRSRQRRAFRLLAQSVSHSETEHARPPYDGGRGAASGGGDDARYHG